MMQLFTPKQWYSLFECPSLIIDDDGKIWAADQYYRILSGEPSGRIDYTGGKIYGSDMGYGLFSSPIAYLETRNGVTEIRDANQGLFSAPVLYIRNNKVYTAEEYCSIFSTPSGYIRSGNSGDGLSGGSASRHTSAGRSGGGSGSHLIGIVSFGLLLILPGILFNITWIFIALAAIYLIATIVTTIRYGADFRAMNIAKGLLYGFLTLAGVYLTLFVITTLVSGYNRDTMNELQGLNELAGWIAGAGTFLLQCGKGGKP